MLKIRLGKALAWISHKSYIGIHTNLTCVVRTYPINIYIYRPQGVKKHTHNAQLMSAFMHTMLAASSKATCGHLVCRPKFSRGPYCKFWPCAVFRLPTFDKVCRLSCHKLLVHAPVVSRRPAIL